MPCSAILIAMQEQGFGEMIHFDDLAIDITAK